MNSTTQALFFALAGLCAANVAAWLALGRQARLRTRVAAPVAAVCGWLALGAWLDPGMLRATHPYHALVSALALFCVMGFPAFAASRVLRK